MNLFLLHWRNELWKLFGKKRTYIGFGAFLLVQLTIILICFYNESARQRVLAAGGTTVFTSLTCASVMILPLAMLLLPLYVTLIGGDLVAKEAEEGTLRMVLARPISRSRLLFVKWLSGVVFCAVIVMALGGFALALSSIWFPWGGMQVFVPGEMFAVFDARTGVERYLAAHAMMISKAVTLVTLAFMFSCFNIRPAAATVLALSVVFTDNLLRELPFFVDLRPWFITSHLNFWRLLLYDPIPWWRVFSSLCLLAAFNFTFLTVGIASFQVRDIKS